jgi:putative ABC transport system substrate-binding protein
MLLCVSMVVVALLSGCAGPLSPSPKVYRIGWLAGSTQAETATEIEAFRQALRELGYVEGRNFSLEIRYAEGHAERNSALAAELVALRVDVLLTIGLPEALTLKQATSTIPIVIADVPDPVENGLVVSLARPGGNITGPAWAGAEIAQRRLQLLKETVPGASRVAYLFDASNPSQVRLYQEARSAAATLGIELQPLEVHAPRDFADAFATIGRAHPDAIDVGGGALFGSQRPQILDFIAASRLPSMTAGARDYVDRGALMYYAPDLVQIIRRAAAYVDRILKGANPADLPLEKPTKYDLIINMRTAKALGLTIPPSVLAQATEVIQ